MCKKLTKKAHDLYYGHRFDLRPGIKYFSFKDYKNLKVEPFHFINKNNNILNGFYYYKENYNKNNIVIFCHGMGGGHQAYISEIAYLCDNGFFVVAFDYQGCMSSEGKNAGGFLQNASDIDDCLNYLNSLDQFKNKTKYIIGHSWGGFGAQSVLDKHFDVKKLVMISGIIDIKIAYKQFVPLYAKILQPSLLKYEKNLYPQYFNNNAITNLNKRNDVSALIIQSKDDCVVSYKLNFLKMQKFITNKNVTFLSMNNKNHNPQYSFEAVKKLVSYLSKLETIKSDDEKNKLADKTDFRQLCELDFVIMNKIIDFLNH